MTFISPGRLYIQGHGTVSTFEDILLYAEFLQTETGMNGKLPVDLDEIYKHFEIPEPKSVPLSNQQGLLLDPELGIIVINSGDSEKRQKFTKAHELVEMLFSELPQGREIGNGWRLNRPGGFKGSTKEFLCNWTAANLLMPPDFVQTQIRQYSANFECGRVLAATCDVSLSAALVQVARISHDGHFVVLWRMKNKPTEQRNTPSPAQATLFALDNNPRPQKLRVEWSLGGINSPFIPNDKSTETTSQIHKAWDTNTYTFGKDRMTFDNRASSWFYSENMPFVINEERYVISLMQKI